MCYSLFVFFSSDPSCFSYSFFYSVLYVWWSGNPLIIHIKIFFSLSYFYLRHKFSSYYISFSIIWVYLSKYACCLQRSQVFCCALITMQGLEITEHKDSLGIQTVIYRMKLIIFLTTKTFLAFCQNLNKHIETGNPFHIFHMCVCTDFMQQLLCEEILKKKRN